MKKITVVNKEVLKKLKACEDGIRFFVRNIGELPVDKLDLVEGDYKHYVEWLKNAVTEYNNKPHKPPVKEFERVYNLDGSWFEFTRDKFGYTLTYKNSDGYWSDYTRDKNGKILSFKNSNGVSYEYTRDENGNELHYKNSSGNWSEYTRDENGAVLTYKNSDDFSYEYTRDKYGNELTRKDNEGYWCEYTRDKFGNELTFKNSNGDWSEYKYEHTKEYFKMYENDKLILTVIK